jgi:hypothetical protein
LWVDHAIILSNNIIWKRCEVGRLFHKMLTDQKVILTGYLKLDITREYVLANSNQNEHIPYKHSYLYVTLGNPTFGKPTKQIMCLSNKARKRRSNGGGGGGGGG